MRAIRTSYARTPTALFAIAAAIGLYVVLPDVLVVLNDDFGYVRSIVETYRRGRPFTDAWLEPWAASVSSIGALFFAVTGSMRFATYGQVALASAASLVILASLLRARHVRAGRAALLALVAVTFPTLLCKTFEFGAIPLYLACLLGSVWAVENRRPSAFGLAFVLALASRQSALVFLLLPVGAALGARTRTGAIDLRRAVAPALGALFFGAIAYVAIRRGMNVTHAQRVMMPSLLSAATPRTFAWHAGLGLAVHVVSIGIGACVLDLLGGLDRARTRATRALTVVGVLSVTALCVLPVREHLAFEHLLFDDRRGHVYVALLLGASLYGLSRGPRIRAWYPIVAVASSVLLGLRATIWDYYLLDVVVLGLLAPAATAIPLPSRYPLGTPLLVALVAFHVSFVGATKRWLDDTRATVALYERALRAGAITADAISGAPFGYQGYVLYPHFVTHQGRDGMHIGGFLRYVSPDATRVVITAGREPAPDDVLHEGERVIGSGAFDFGWTKRRRYTLVRSPHATPPAMTLSSDYVREAFPLGDVEWARVLRASTRDQTEPR